MKKYFGEKRLLLHAGVVFLLLLTLSLLLTAFVMRSSLRQERERMGYAGHSLAAEIYEVMLSEMSKTRVLEAYLLQSGGNVQDFEEIAHVLLREDFVRNVLFAPDGIVSAVYPLKGNEDVIGLNMYEHGAGNQEAQAAIEKRELYVAGPFELVQGGTGIAGRLPVFLEEEGEQSFWGVVSVTLDFPAVLSGSSIGRMEEQGFACQVWRVNPDTGQRQTILTTDAQLPEGKATVDYPLQLFNAVWTVSVAALCPWYARSALWLGVVAGILLSLASAAVVYSMKKLHRLQAEAAEQEIERLQQQLEYEQGSMLLSQIRSHFFYHTLNALQALIVLQPQAAYKMSGDFSRYLRFNLDAATATGGIGSFRQELRAVRAYADINQQQLGERLRVVYDVADQDFSIPLLTIQPVVENAILHGIKPKVGGGTVTLSLEEGAEHWLVTVADDGVGFDVSAAVPGRGSIGLENVRKRMARIAGCSIEIESVPGVGTRVLLFYQKNLEIPQ